MREASRTSKPRQPTGRPARLSREAILGSALDMLRESGGQDLSIRQLAQRLATVPGNLYTYFPNKEALLDALAEYALQSLEITADTSLPWDAQITEWMNAFRNTLQQRPELMLLLGLAGTSPSTLARIGRIARLIENAGLDYASAVLHAQGLLWTVMSYTLFEMQASDVKVVKRLQQAAAHEKQSTHEKNSDVLQHLAVENLQPLWETTLRRNLDGIRLQARAT
ncbi:MAG TPA: TetR/AcrR family transcriptional regulator [Pseudomonadales bacterium]|nr:TetR/AcrR family transcriptional regulator [Pseudomonadales bacterium]